MYAIDDLSDAIDVTREFLTPIRPWMWLKLALLLFFIGGVGFGNPVFSGGGGGVSDEGTAVDPGTVDVGEWLPILIVVAVAVLLVGLAFLLLGSIFEFTFLESLRSGEVHVRRYTKRNVGHGVQLFGFRVVLGLIATAAIGLPVAAVFLSGSDAVSLAMIVVVILVAFPVGLAYAVISRFTTVFIAPTMLQEDLGVVAAWRRFWPTLSGNWAEYLVYLLLVWLLQLVFAFAIGIALFILAIPIVIVLFVLLFIPFLNLLVLLVAIPLLVVLVLLVQVPVVVYLRYYALLMLGDTDPGLDLIPDRRATIRGGGPGTGDSWETPDDRGDGEPRDERDDRGPADDDLWDDDSESFDSRWDESDSDDSSGWGDRNGSDGGDGDESDDDGDDWGDSSGSDEDDDRDDRGGW
ncbi:hypothetical protein A6E15_11500 [Natrinema saccharevitans]|uniref:Uncharacterized protein n=1 Tax=Natrinema saccharevitans TaxID=301967 RepID=A0A1S8AXH8_9EURY|nr:hypothetical protein [Natrinema saccharevitans]OLZ41568.1 hypothetical protein A6E15_11500 [Natrinema saccharevitans]